MLEQMRVLEVNELFTFSGVLELLKLMFFDEISECILI